MSSEGVDRIKPFSESMRYEYGLTPDSWVVDAGAYRGTFSREITRRYDCYVLGFEPIISFWHQACKDQTSKVMICPMALGDFDGEATFGVSNDWTGNYCDSREHSIIRVHDVIWLSRLIPHIDLLKLNIEGMEYAVLERILEKGLQSRIDNIQVQFHTCAPDYHQRRLAIMDKLADTHVLTYEYPYVWESWKRK